METRIKVGIIGYGKIGRKRHDVINDDKLLLKAIVNPSAISICNDVQYFRNHKDLIKSTNLDAVFVCVPHTLSKGIVVDCLDAKLHVFCEKPPGINMEDINDMKIAHRRNPDKILMFGFNHRYLSHIRQAKQIIESGRLGSMLWIRGIYGKSHMESDNWRHNKRLGGYGILLGQGIHMIDLISYLSGDDFRIIKSVVSHKTNQWYEDNVMAIMKGINTDASIHSSCIMPKNTFNIIIGFERGYMEIDGLGCSSTKSFGFPDKLIVGYSDEESFYGNPKTETYFYGSDSGDNSWKIEVDNFTKAISEKQMDYPCNINDAYLVMELVDKVYKDGK